MKYHPQTHIPLRSILGVLQIGIRAKVIENQIFSCQIKRIPQSPTRRYPVHLEAPPSSDYVPGPEEPKHAPPSPEFVPEPVYPEFMPPEDEVFLAEEQPLPAAVSPNADPPGYIADSDLEEDEEDPEEDPADYPDDDDDVEEDEDDDDDEEEEHPALTDSIPPHVHRIPSPPLPVSSPIPVSPPPLPAIPTSSLGYRASMIWLRAESPSTSHPLPLPSPIVLPRTKEYVAMMRAVAPSTYILASRSEEPPSRIPPLLPIPLPTPSPPLFPPFIDHKVDVREVCLPPWKRLCFALCLRYQVGKSSSAPTNRPTGGFRVDYGFVATLDDEIKRDPERDVGYEITETWDEMLVDMPGAPATDETELGWRLTNFI
ncbi:hypothetical protein Tco_0808548, partial [Tanacetum coccineum]